MIQTLYNGVKFPCAGPDLDNIEKVDLGALPMIHRMAMTGLQVDLSHFAKMEKKLDDDLDRLTEDVHTMTGYRINLDSGDQVSDLLFKKLGIKQARRQFTKSGDRESVINEVLVAIQHTHPVISLILEYKEVSKLNGTYVKPMPKLARRTKFGKWRIHPNFGTTRVPSGRLNCKEPNLLAMPNRSERGREVCEGFITDEGWVYLSVDECLHPDTLVETPKGRVRIAEIRKGDIVFSHDTDVMSCGVVSRSSRMVNKKSYKITFDNGESVIASHDHRWPTQWWKVPSGKGRLTDIVIRRTDELRVGERMVPWKYHKTGAGYTTMYTQKGSFKSKLVHRLVAEAYYGPCPEGHIVHHKDEDKTNFHPDNLEYKRTLEHTSEHGRNNYPKQDHEYRVSRLREGLRGRRTYEGEDNPNSKLKHGDYEAIQTIAGEGEYTYKEIADVFGISVHYVQEIVSRRYTSENHQIVSIECVGMQPMWGITVEGDHTYALSCGVVTHNSQIEPRVVAHRSHDQNLMNIYLNDEDIYSDFAITAFRLEDNRYECHGYNNKCRAKDGTEILCDNNEHIGHGWHYPSVHKKKQRFPAKTCTLASIYDVTAKGLVEQLPVVCSKCYVEAKDHLKTTCTSFKALWQEDNAQSTLINPFYMRYKGILDMRRMDHARIRKHQMVWDDWGRIMHCTAIKSVHKWVQAAALREGANMPIQGTAQGTVKITMARVDDEFTDMRVYGDLYNPLLQIHDELLGECRRDVADEIGYHISKCFEECVRLDVPIKAGVAMADSWGLMPK